MFIKINNYLLNINSIKKVELVNNLVAITTDLMVGKTRSYQNQQQYYSNNTISIPSQTSSSDYFNYEIYWTKFTSLKDFEEYFNKEMKLKKFNAKLDDLINSD